VGYFLGVPFGFWGLALFGLVGFLCGLAIGGLLFSLYVLGSALLFFNKISLAYQKNIMLLKVILLYPCFPLLVNVGRSMIQVVSLLDG
jgi:hypothetical protein